MRITKGKSTALPRRLQIHCSSNRPAVVCVDHAGTIRTVGPGVATVTVVASYHGASVRTSFVVDVAGTA